MWPRHVTVHNPGRMFNEARMYSIEVAHQVFGIVILISFYGVTGDAERTYANLSRVLKALEETSCPYIVCGDFNIDEKDMSIKLSEEVSGQDSSWRPHVLLQGKCVDHRLFHCQLGLKIAHAVRWKVALPHTDPWCSDGMLSKILCK